MYLNYLLYLGLVEKNGTTRIFSIVIKKIRVGSFVTLFNPRPAGEFSRTRPAGGGGQILPPCLTPELIGAARRARRRSKALNEKIPMHIKKNSLRGHM